MTSSWSGGGSSGRAGSSNAFAGCLASCTGTGGEIADSESSLGQPALGQPALEQVEQLQDSESLLGYPAVEQLEKLQHVESSPVSVLQLLLLHWFSWIRRSANWEALQSVALAVAAGAAAAAKIGPNFQASPASWLVGRLEHSNSSLAEPLVQAGSVVEQALRKSEGRDWTNDGVHHSHPAALERAGHRPCMPQSESSQVKDLGPMGTPPDGLLVWPFPSPAVLISF